MATFVHSRVGQATGGLSRLMGILVQVSVLIHYERRVVWLVLHLESAVDLDWVLVASLMGMCLVTWLAHGESAWSAHRGVRVDTSTGLESFEDIILAWNRSAVALR